MDTPQVTADSAIMKSLQATTHVCDNCNTMQGSKYQKQRSLRLPSCLACGTPVPLRRMDDVERGNRALDRWLRLTYPTRMTFEN